MYRFLSTRYILQAILFFSFILGINIAFAQQLQMEEVKVVAPFEPTISDAFKINFNPAIEDTIKVNIAFNYSINPQVIPVKFNMEPLTAARMRGEPLQKLYKGLVKGGIGNYKSPYGELFYNTLRSNEYHYGIHAKHLSSGGGINDYAYSGNSDNQAKLYGMRFFRNHTLYADVDYNRNTLHYYGFKPDEITDRELIDTLGRKDYRQRFNYVSPGIGFRSNYLDSLKLQHSLNLRYYFYNDRYDASEQNVNLTSQLRKTFKEDIIGLDNRQTFQLDLEADYFLNKHNLDSLRHTGLFKVAPILSSRYDVFDFYVGINTKIQVDTVNQIEFYPLAGAQVDLIKDVLFAYVTLSGDLTKHTMRNLTQTNPFIITSAPYGFMNRKAEIRGGFKGSISSFASYNVTLSNSEIDNYPFFVTDFSSPLANQFNVIYDKVKVFNFRTEIFSNIGERVKVRFLSDYYQFTPENELEAWHEPTLRFTLNVKYNIQDKIIFNVDGFARNSTFARIPDTESTLGFRSEKIHGFHVDANLGIEYRYTKVLSVFLHLNNMQNQSLVRWYNYPSHRFNVMGGVTYAF